MELEEVEGEADLADPADDHDARVLHRVVGDDEVTDEVDEGRPAGAAVDGGVERIGERAVEEQLEGELGVEVADDPAGQVPERGGHEERSEQRELAGGEVRSSNRHGETLRLDRATLSDRA